LEPAWRLPKAVLGSEEADVIYVTALITALLFVYLGVALVRPEWF
jgi:K+-transporting ATPase KdpF subunit